MFDAMNAYSFPSASKSDTDCGWPRFLDSAEYLGAVQQAAQSRQLYSTKPEVVPPVEERRPPELPVLPWPGLGQPCYLLPPDAAAAAVAQLEGNSQVVLVRWDRIRVVAWNTFRSVRHVHAAVVALGRFGILLVDMRSGDRRERVGREGRATNEKGPCQYAAHEM
jgi:hypothetical protein